jgi:hypothetical protein
MLTLVCIVWIWLKHYQVRRKYREATEHLIDILARCIEETRTHTIYSTAL